MQNQKAVSLEQVLQNVSANLESLFERTAELEVTVCQMIDENNKTSGAFIYEMQALDRVNQGLQDMVVLTALLAKSAGAATVSHNQAEEICKTVKLTTTKELVLEEPRSNGSLEEPLSPSDVHLF